MCLVGGNLFPLEGKGCWQLLPYPPPPSPHPRHGNVSCSYILYIRLAVVNTSSCSSHARLALWVSVGPPAASAAQIPMQERGGGWLWPVLPLAGEGGLWQPSSFHLLLSKWRGVGKGSLHHGLWEKCLEPWLPCLLPSRPAHG